MTRTTDFRITLNDDGPPAEFLLDPVPRRLTTVPTRRGFVRSEEHQNTWFRSQEVARLTARDAEIVLYHDSSARDRGLSFLPVEPDKATDELSRAERVQREAHRVLTCYFRWDSKPVYTKRPDVIVLEVREGDRYEYLVTEVKNSTRRETIHRGIEETPEYLAFLRQDDEFVFDDETEFF